MPAPDPFLNPVNINTGSQRWNAILKHPTLLIRIRRSSGPILDLSSDFFWGLIFSSSQNAAKFGSFPASPSNAAVGDDARSAVLGMSPSLPATFPGSLTFADARAKFGIVPGNTPTILLSFLNAVEGTRSVGLKLDLAPNAQSALWAVPGDVYRVVVILDYKVQETSFLGNAMAFINAQYGLGIGASSMDSHVILTRISSYRPNSVDTTLIDMFSTYKMVISAQIGELEICAIFSPTGLDLQISNPKNAAPAQSSVISQLNTAVLRQNASTTSSNLKTTDLPNPGQAGIFNTLFAKVGLWYLSIEKEVDSIVGVSNGPPPPPASNAVDWQIGMLVNWKVGQPAQDVLLSLEYESDNSRLTGKLLCSGDLPAPAAMRRFDYDWQMDIPPAIKRILPESIDLWKVLTTAAPPSGLPHLMSHATFTYRKDKSGNGYVLSVSTAIFADASAVNPQKSVNAAPEGFSWDMISVNAVLQQTTSNPLTKINLSSTFSLKTSQSVGNAFPPAFLAVDLQYSTAGSWSLHGAVANLSVGLLYEYFDKSVRNSAIGILGKLNLRSLEMWYTFSGSGDASSFLITAILTLGELEFDLTYQYASELLTNGEATAAQKVWGANGTASNVKVTLPVEAGNATGSNWSFEAYLGASSPGSTVGSIANSISRNAATSLPSFVRNIAVNPASGIKAPVKLILRGDGTYVAMALWISLGDLDFTFVSLSGSGPGTKHVLRIRVDKLPLISSIPLVNMLPQPFDEMLYLWLDDNGDSGLSQPELDHINAELQILNIPKIEYKESSPIPSPYAVLQTGHHFMVVEKGTVILDHCFADAMDQPSGPSNAEPAIHSFSLLSLPIANTGQEPPPTKGALDKQLPFISITAISLQYKKGTLAIIIDATIKLGPISFSVIGFEVDITLSSSDPRKQVRLNHLSDIITNGLVSVKIHGLDVDVEKKPLTLAGVFIHDTGPGEESYRGGIKLGFEEWQFLAVGEYEIISGFRSVFVYAKLDGPLVTLAFATISGVRLGFGYNSVVRQPTLVDLAQFPFLDDSVDNGAGTDPMKVLQVMLSSSGTQAWVSPKEDSYWVAAGLTLTAFGILNITAILMLEFQPSGVIISVFADGIAQMPPEADADKTLFYVEIGMLAEMNTVDGYFTVQAALAPSSHVLVPSCRLTGGFALVNWFHPNAHAGDFVFTVGGFHRAYSPPSWYPVPPRLGISFTLGGMINVTGNVYFAITPKCVMGGGALHLGLEVGPVSAWLDVALDVFVQFKPFHYTADLTVSVGCAISINVWFVHVRVSVSVGAALHIEGPSPFGGFANVDFYLFSFTIHFGGKIAPPPPSGLLEFYQMVKTPGPDSIPGATAGNDLDPMLAQLKFTLTGGLFPQQLPPSPNPSPAPASFPDSGASKPWNVKAGTFSFTIGADFALSAVSIQDSPSFGTFNPPPRALATPNGSTRPNAFFSKPMHLSTPIESEMTISIYKFGDNNQTTLMNGFTGQLILKDVPTALWGAYDTTADPALTKNPEALKDPSQPTMQLCMGVTITAPLAQRALSSVQDFDVTVAFLDDIGPFGHPPLEPQQSTLLASGEATGSGPEKWVQAATDWKKFANTGAAILGGAFVNGVQGDGMLKMAAHWLQWDKPPPGTDVAPIGGRAPWMLDGSVPTPLIKRLDTEYPVLPRYSASRTP